MSWIVGIDPGPEESAAVSMFTGDVMPVDCENYSNARLIPAIAHWRSMGYAIGIEGFEPYGQRLGWESIRTIQWLGVFCYKADCEPILRSEVKIHLCGIKSAKDSDIRDALIERFGPGRKAAFGTKASHGPLYDITHTKGVEAAHLWPALAVAVTLADKLKKEKA